MRAAAFAAAAAVAVAVSLLSPAADARVCERAPINAGETVCTNAGCFWARGRDADNNSVSVCLECANNNVLNTDESVCEASGVCKFFTDGQAGGVRRCSVCEGRSPGECTASPDCEYIDGICRDNCRLITNRVQCESAGCFYNASAPSNRCSKCAGITSGCNRAGCSLRQDPADPSRAICVEIDAVTDPIRFVFSGDGVGGPDDPSAPLDEDSGDGDAGTLVAAILVPSLFICICGWTILCCTWAYKTSRWCFRGICGMPGGKREGRRGRRNSFANGRRGGDGGDDDFLDMDSGPGDPLYDAATDVREEEFVDLDPSIGSRRRWRRPRFPWPGRHESLNPDSY